MLGAENVIRIDFFQTGGRVGGEGRSRWRNMHLMQNLQIVLLKKIVFFYRETIQYFSDLVSIANCMSS